MRSYAATLGRWLTPDPAGLAAVDPGNPQSWNRYAYVLNDPASAFDPLGLDTHPCSGSTSNGLPHFCSQVNGNGLSNAVQLGLDQMTLGGFHSPYDGVPAPFHPSGGGVSTQTPPPSPKAPPPPPPPTKQNKPPSKDPCPPLAHDPGAHGIDTLFDGVNRITHPLDMVAINASMFLVAGGQVVLGGAAILGGCVEPTPAEPLTCVAGVAGGATAFVSAAGSAAVGIDFFIKQTIPAIKNWGCDE